MEDKPTEQLAQTKEIKELGQENLALKEKLEAANVAAKQGVADGSADSIESKLEPQQCHHLQGL